MRDRSATSGLDKIAGLNYLSDVGLRGALPIYIVGDDPENAWRRFIYALPAVDRVDMLFFPIPGAGGRGTPSWYPSWRRLREAPRLYMDSNDFTQKGVNFDKSRNEYMSTGSIFHASDAASRVSLSCQIVTKGTMTAKKTTGTATKIVERGARTKITRIRIMIVA